MYNSSPEKPLWVTVLLSCFVPVGTFAVGKVLGSLFQVRDTLITEATETPRVQELTGEIERLKDRIVTQTKAEQVNIERAVQAARQQERDELAPYRRVVQETTFPSLSSPVSLPGPAVAPEPQTETSRNIELRPLQNYQQARTELEETAAPDDDSSGDESQRNHKETLRTLSKLQREVFTFVKETGPSATTQIAEDLKRPEPAIQKVLDVLVEKQVMVEDNGIFQAII